MNTIREYYTYILEDIEDISIDNEKLNLFKDSLWLSIKMNDNESILENLRNLRHTIRSIEDSLESLDLTLRDSMDFDESIVIAIEDIPIKKNKKSKRKSKDF